MVIPATPIFSNLKVGDDRPPTVTSAAAAKVKYLKGGLILYHPTSYSKRFGAGNLIWILSAVEDEREYPATSELARLGWIFPGKICGSG